MSTESDNDTDCLKSSNGGCCEVHEYENSRISSEKLCCSSKMKPRLRTEWVA